MATYVIGDVHGCFDTLQALWAQLGFKQRHDRLWLVGDLVNRGPKSLEVLRWAKDLDERLGERMQVVLGNHDLHLLAMHDGHAKPRPKDTLEAVLAATDREPLVDWLARRPLVHRDGRMLLVHAGLLPRWSPKKAVKIARGLEKILRQPHKGSAKRRRRARERRRPLLDRTFDADDRLWAKPRADLQAFIGLRTCTGDGEPCGFKGPPDQAPPGCLPWFRVPGRRGAKVTVIFGHWAAMGLHIEPTVIGLDSGCVWGRCLSAARLEDRTLFQQEALEHFPGGGSKC